MQGERSELYLHGWGCVSTGAELAERPGRAVKRWKRLRTAGMRPCTQASAAARSRAPADPLGGSRPLPVGFVGFHNVQKAI